MHSIDAPVKLLIMLLLLQLLSYRSQVVASPLTIPQAGLSCRLLALNYLSKTP